MVRRILSATAALGVLVEGVVFCGLLYVLAATTWRYDISMAGRPADEAVTMLWVLIAALGVVLLTIAAALLVNAVGSGLGRWGRVIVIGALPLQWILTVVGGLVIGLGAFVGFLAIFGLLLDTALRRPDPVVAQDRSGEEPADEVA